MNDMQILNNTAAQGSRRLGFFNIRVFIVATVLCCTFVDSPLFAKKVSTQRQTLITYSLKFMGTPYVSGATGPDGFDCSGFVITMSHDAIGFQLPRTAQSIYASDKVEHISPTVREPGDLVFFKSTETGAINHVGIYVGKRKFIHAASDGPHTGVIISTLDEKYWHAHYAGSGRFLPTTAEAE